MLCWTTARSNSQTIILDSYTGEDSGIDVTTPGNDIIPYGKPVTMEWSQSGSFSDVSISVVLASFGSSGSGYATVSSASGQIASTDFDFPIKYGSVDLFDGLTLPPDTYSLNIGAFSGSDDGWACPVGGTIISADGVDYINTYTPYGLSNVPVDFLIESVPEPSTGAWYGVCLLAIAGFWPRAKHAAKSGN